MVFLVETDDRRVAATLQMVDAYEAQQDFTKAEQLLIEMWSRLTEGMCNFRLAVVSSAMRMLTLGFSVANRKSQTSELRDSEFEAAIAYIEFLQRRTRDFEATSILLGL